MMSKSRLTSFMDGVLAIIMTILIFGLQKPDPVSFAGFWALRENFFAYTMSFFWLGTMWVNWHVSWGPIKKINGQIVWAAIITLFFSSLFPYTTQIVAASFNNAAAQAFYGIVVLLITLANQMLYHLLKEANKHDEKLVSQMNNRGKWLWIDILIKLAGLVIALTVYPPAMMYSVLLAAVVIIIPNQIQHFKKMAKLDN